MVRLSLQYLFSQPRNMGYLSFSRYHPQFLSPHIISPIYFIMFSFVTLIFFSPFICHGLRLESPKAVFFFFLYFSLNHLEVFLFLFFCFFCFFVFNIILEFIDVHTFISLEMCTLWHYTIPFLSLLNTFWPESNFV